MSIVIRSGVLPVAMSLEADGPAALRDLRRALGSLLATLPPMRRAIDLSQTLNLDRSLAWKVWRVAQGPDELPSPKHVPGRAAMTTFIEAAARAGGAPRELGAVRESYARLEGIYKRHAADRASAEILLGQFTDEGRSRLEVQLRRDAFRAYSHFFGVRMRLRHQLDVLLPSGPGHMPQLARVRGHYGLQRTRADARWVLSRGYVMHDGGPTTNYQREALAGDGDPRTDVPIAPRFCSPGDLPLQRECVAGHTFVDELAPGPVGEAAAADIVTAERIYGIPRKPGPTDVLGVHMRTPSERLCYELLVHRDLAALGTPTLDVFTTLNASAPQATPDPRDRVPIIEKLRSLGSADGAAAAVDVPRHGELTRWVFERLGHRPEDFVVHRLEMRFPPVAIVLRLTYPVP